MTDNHSTKGNYPCTEGFEISSSLATFDVGSATFLNITRLNQAAILKSGSSISLTFGSSRLFLYSMMILCGDIEVNPGPKWRFPCDVCKKPVKCNQNSCSATSAISGFILAVVRLTTKPTTPLRIRHAYGYVQVMIHQSFQTHCLVAPSKLHQTPAIHSSILSESLQPTSSEADLGSPRSATKHTSTSRKKSQYLQKLKVLNLNCNSIRSQHKSGLFKAKVEDEKPHIIIANESKLDDSIRNSEVFPSDYEIFRKDRKDVNPGGGVFIVVHNTIIATHQSKLDCQAEAIWIKIEIANIHSRRVQYKKAGTWNDSPWITKDLKRSLRRKKRLYNNYKRSGLTKDKQKYRKFQKMLKTELRKAQDEYIGSTLDCDLKEKPKKFWSYIKSKKQDQVGVPPLNVSGSVKTGSASKAEILNFNFRQIFTQEDLSSMSRKGCRDTPPMDSPMEHLLKNLDSKKANGPDKLPTTLLKITASEIAEVVTFLFNQSYDYGELPEDW